MKKLILLSILFIVGCPPPTGPEPEDCAGVAGGTAVEDECGTCDNDSANDCVQDCAGEWGGAAVLSGCDNICNSTAVVDDCGVCGGDGVPCEETVAGNYTATTDLFFYNSECSGEGVDYLGAWSVKLILNSDGSALMTRTQGDDEVLLACSWTTSSNLVIMTFDDNYTETYIFTDNSLIFQKENSDTCIYLVYTRDG